MNRSRVVLNQEFIMFFVTSAKEFKSFEEAMNFAKKCKNDMKFGNICRMNNSIESFDQLIPALDINKCHGLQCFVPFEDLESQDSIPAQNNNSTTAALTVEVNNFKADIGNIKADITTIIEIFVKAEIAKVKEMVVNVEKVAIEMAKKVAFDTAKEVVANNITNGVAGLSAEVALQPTKSGNAELNNSAEHPEVTNGVTTEESAGTSAEVAPQPTESGDSGLDGKHQDEPENQPVESEMTNQNDDSNSWKKNTLNKKCKLVKASIQRDDDDDDLPMLDDGNNLPVLSKVELKKCIIEHKKKNPSFRENGTIIKTCINLLFPDDTTSVNCGNNCTYLHHFASVDEGDNVCKMMKVGTIVPIGYSTYKFDNKLWFARIRNAKFWFKLNSKGKVCSILDIETKKTESALTFDDKKFSIPVPINKFEKRDKLFTVDNKYM